MTEGDLPRRLQPEANTLAWLLRHIGEVELLFAKNVFGLGDTAGLFTEKTGERARKQAATLARNLQRMIAEER